VYSMVSRRDYELKDDRLVGLFGFAAGCCSRVSPDGPY